MFKCIPGLKKGGEEMGARAHNNQETRLKYLGSKQRNNLRASSPADL